MYTIYTDKSEDFKCKIAVEGSKLSDTIARLVIESDDVSLLFEGTIDSDGLCTVPIKKIRKLLDEGDSGKMKLEVIAEDTFFSPWEDEYDVKASKKVTVEMVKPNETIKESRVKVEVTPQVPQEKPKKRTITEKKLPTKKSNHGKTISEFLTKKGITLSNIEENKNNVVKIIKEYSKLKNIKLDNSVVLDEILDNLDF